MSPTLLQRNECDESCPPSFQPINYAIIFAGSYVPRPLYRQPQTPAFEPAPPYDHSKRPPLLHPPLSPSLPSHTAAAHDPPGHVRLVHQYCKVHMNSLPPELLHVLNQAYFLHVLATDPAKLIPPGKSLLSMMTRSQPVSIPETTETVLHDRVEKVVHQAFWNEALESLSSSEPSVQLLRLKGLYADLHESLAPLFPVAHTVLQALSSPLPPTSSPLRSTLVLLDEILAALRERCAPVRDPDIDALRISINSPPHPPASLAALVIDTFKALIALASTLKADLTQSVLGAMSESQLTAVIAQQARSREQEIVLELWGGADNIRTAWRAWTQYQHQHQHQVRTALERKKHLARVLTSALGSTTAVSCDAPLTFPPPSSVPTPHHLPPQFFFTAPTLLYLQNYLQALVIAACLRALTHLPPAVPTDFVARIWALLKAEIDGNEYAIGVPSPALSLEGSEDPTRLLNLADEVVRAMRLGDMETGEGQNKEDELRAAVERTLKPRDPVFLLLLGRLVKAVSSHLDNMLDAASSGEESRGVPQRMQTGRSMRGIANGFVSGVANKQSTSLSVAVKGFEDPVLVNGIEDVTRKILYCIEWVDEVWGSYD
ncbi:hypothetical protein BDZ94DRAFT_1296760 [Collybia nuda]|uniref:Uncharacterized protein n=1 Tax=Collybia nuda TaxID=64659 RepID=A0A9P5Y7H0_9AGAR|nr:hypothetical protein BDZ94DRAFT_1296760 [Collybia nuda]